MLSHDLEAVRFLQSFTEYCHAIDDIIDGDKSKPEDILKTFAGAALLYSSNFYHRYYTQLYPLILTITNNYADSVKWEKSKEQWRLGVSDVLRSAAHDMICCVVGICCSYDAMREISIEIREATYEKNHDELGNPI